jgi:hypothetical protein
VVRKNPGRSMAVLLAVVRRARGQVVSSGGDRVQTGVR